MKLIDGWTVHVLRRRNVYRVNFLGLDMNALNPNKIHLVFRNEETGYIYPITNRKHSYVYQQNILLSEKKRENGTIICCYLVAVHHTFNDTLRGLAPLSTVDMLWVEKVRDVLPVKLEWITKNRRLPVYSIDEFEESELFTSAQYKK